jgi:hypothetical protein
MRGQAVRSGSAAKGEKMLTVWSGSRKAATILSAVILTACSDNSGVGVVGPDATASGSGSATTGGGTNRAPILVGIDVIPRVLPFGGTVVVDVAASDPDGDLIRYEFIPSGGSVFNPDPSMPNRVVFLHDGQTAVPQLIVRMYGGGATPQESVIRFAVSGAPSGGGGSGDGGTGGGDSGGNGGSGGGGAATSTPTPAPSGPTPGPTSAPTSTPAPGGTATPVLPPLPTLPPVPLPTLPPVPVPTLPPPLPPNAAPNVSGGASLGVPLIGAVILSGSVSDPNGDSVSCHFDADGCINLSLTVETAPNPTTAAVLIGCNNGQVSLVCVDSHGAVGSTTWSLHR